MKSIYDKIMEIPKKKRQKISFNISLGIVFLFSLLTLFLFGNMISTGVTSVRLLTVLICFIVCVMFCVITAKIETYIKWQNMLEENEKFRISMMKAVENERRFKMDKRRSENDKSGTGDEDNEDVKNDEVSADVKDTVGIKDSIKKIN